MYFEELSWLSSSASAIFNCNVFILKPKLNFCFQFISYFLLLQVKGNYQNCIIQYNHYFSCIKKGARYRGQIYVSPLKVLFYIIFARRPLFTRYPHRKNKQISYQQNKLPKYYKINLSEQKKRKTFWNGLQWRRIFLTNFYWACNLGITNTTNKITQPRKFSFLTQNYISCQFLLINNKSSLTRWNCVAAEENYSEMKNILLIFRL